MQSVEVLTPPTSGCLLAAPGRVMMAMPGKSIGTSCRWSDREGGGVVRLKGGTTTNTSSMKQQSGQAGSAAHKRHTHTCLDTVSQPYAGVYDLPDEVQTYTEFDT